MLCDYSHRLQILKLWLKSVLRLLKYRTFFLDIVFIGAPVHACIHEFCSVKKEIKKLVIYQRRANDRGVTSVLD